jgi:hypothetical protein
MGTSKTKIRIIFVAVILSAQSLCAIDLMINDERINNIHLLSDNTSLKHLSLFLAPAWYDRRGENESRSDPFPRDDHYFKIVSLDSHLIVDEKAEANLNFKTIKSFPYTHCTPLSFFENHILWVHNDFAGITMWRNQPGFNPIDMFGVSKVPLENNANKIYTENISKYRSINYSVRAIPVLAGDEEPVPRKKPILEAMSPGKVFALTGMYDDKLRKGYCVGLSKAEEYDGVKYWSSAKLWISAFSAPEFNVSEIRAKAETIIVKSPLTTGSIVQEVWTGDVKKDRFTHIAATFFNAIPLLVYRNERDQSIRVMDYDPQLMLTGSPSCQVTLPHEFQIREVESLLLTSGKEIAYLGVVFSGKKTDESKTLFLFYRTKTSTDWKEYNQFELPNDSLSPTMCLQGNDLFYAYLQPVVIENPPEIADKNGKTSTEKKLVIFKHTLNSSLTQSKKP